MIRAFLRKARADLRTRRVQTASITLILALAAAVLTLGVSLVRCNSMQDIWDRFFAQSNGAHIWFTGNSATTDLASIGSLDGVTSTVGPLPYLRGHSVVKGHNKFELGILGMSAVLPSVGRPSVTDGQWLDADADDEIVLDRGFARVLGLKVGDPVDILTMSGKVTLKIVGLAANPSQGPYPDVLPGLGYALPSTLSRIEPDARYMQWRLGVRLADPDSTQAFLKRVSSVVPEASLAETVDWRQVREQWVRDVSNPSFDSFLVLFGIFALVAAGFAIANVIGGIVLSQYREIGLLKAVGFRPGQVTLLFLIEYLGIGLVATVIGLGLGTAIAPYFLRRIGELLGTGSAPAFDPLWFSVILLGVEAAVALFVFLPARRGGRISTVRAITTGFARVHRRPSRLARLSSRLGLPPSVTLGLKDTFARPLRSCLTIGGLVLTTVIPITMIVGVNSIQHMIAVAVPYDMTVQRGFLSDAETQKLLNRPEIEAYYDQAVVDVKIPAQGSDFNAEALGGAYERYVNVAEGRAFSGPGEAIVTQGLLDLTGSRIGDELHLSINGQPLTLRATGRYFDIGANSLGAMFALDALRQLSPNASPTSYFLSLKPGADPKALEDDLLRQSKDQFDVGIIDRDTILGKDRVLQITYGFNTTLGLIAVATLFITTLLGVRERRRDFGIFKTIGLTPGQVVVGVIAGIVPLALVAVTIAIPLGVWLTQVISDALGRSVGMGTGLMSLPAWWWFALLYPVSLALAALGGFFPARQAAQVKVVEVLRYE